jgi:hypothetical protein
MEQAIWNLEGITVIPTNIAIHEQDVWIIGHARQQRQRGNDPVQRFFTWQAKATPQGYIIVTRNLSGMEEQFIGPTWNLALEVATAIKRTM